MSLVDVADQYPLLVGAFVVAVGWPLLTGLLSFLDGWLAKKSPTAQGLLRAAGFDLKRFSAIVVSTVLQRANLPVPPEIVEAAKKRADLPIGPSHPALVTDSGEIIAAKTTSSSLPAQAKRAVEQAVTAPPKDPPKPSGGVA